MNKLYELYEFFILFNLILYILKYISNCISLILYYDMIVFFVLNYMNIRIFLEMLKLKFCNVKCNFFYLNVFDYIFFIIILFKIYIILKKLVL